MLIRWWKIKWCKAGRSQSDALALRTTFQQVNRQPGPPVRQLNQHLRAIMRPLQPPIMRQGDLWLGNRPSLSRCLLPGHHLCQPLSNSSNSYSKSTRIWRRSWAGDIKWLHSRGNEKKSRSRRARQRNRLPSTTFSRKLSRIQRQWVWKRRKMERLMRVQWMQLLKVKANQPIMWELIKILKGSR